MQLHIPDPAFTDSAQTRARFRGALRFSIAFVVLLWVIELLNGSMGLGLGHYGIHPRDAAGLVGILFAPLLHSGIDHLIANSLPLAILGTVMLHLYPRASRSVLPSVYFLPGIAVWLFARDGVHVGASGLVYGLVSYIFVAGLIRRDRGAIAPSLPVCFLYGAPARGGIPIQPGVFLGTHPAAGPNGAGPGGAL